MTRVGSDSWRARRRLVVVGVGGAAVLAFVLAALWAVTLPPFAGIDEAAHVGYAIIVSEGELPTLATPIPAGDVPQLAEWLARQATFYPHRLVVWTANHPPLAYVLLAPSAAWAADGHLAGIIAARLTMAGALAAAVVTTGWLAREVAPSRPAAAIVAATGLLAVPPLVQHSGYVLTDGVLMAVGTATLAASVRVLRRGRSPGLTAAVALLATAAALARAAGVVIAGMAMAAVAVAGWREAHETGRTARLRRALTAAAPVGAALAAGAGWFYVRNWVRLGDPAGMEALVELTGRTPREGVWDALLDPGAWAGWALDQLGVVAGDDPSAPALVGLAVVVAGLVVAVAAAIRRAGGLAGVAGALRADGGLAWTVALLTAVVMAVGVGMMSWWLQGGNPHLRYLYPAVPVGAVAAGVVASTWRARWLGAVLATVVAGTTIVRVADQAVPGRAPDAVGVLVVMAVLAVGVIGAAGSRLAAHPPPGPRGEPSSLTEATPAGSARRRWPAPPPSAARRGGRSR